MVVDLLVHVQFSKNMYALLLKLSLLLATNTPRKPSMTYLKTELRLKVTCTFQIVFESFGACQMMQLILLKKMLQSVSTRINENKVLVSKLFYEQVSCILMRSIAKFLISRFPEFSMA